MADLTRFLRIREETLDTIIARLDADVNAGVAPDDDAFIDTTEGTWYADLRTAFALECERLWDMASKDTIAASMVEFAWGDYLDAHGASINLPRNDETTAVGEVTFTGAEGVIIGSGTEVSTVQQNADEDAIGFVTTAGGTIPVGGTLTLPVVAVDAGAAGNIPANAISLLMSPITGVTAVTNALACTDGSDVEGDEEYRDRIKLEWSASRGGGSVADYVAWSLDYDGVGFVRVTPLWLGAGTVRITITDVENNPCSAGVVEGLQAALDPYDALTAVNGDQSGPVTTLTVDSAADFLSEGTLIVGDDLCHYTGKTGTTFTGVTGLGTVADNAPVVQSGTGRGLAPVGAIVSVRTAQNLTVNTLLTLELEDGYSIDGDAGTLAVGPEVEALGREYIDSLPPGGQHGSGPDTGAGFVVLNRLVAAALRVPGVFDVTISASSLNGTSADLAVTANQVPVSGTFDLAT